MRSGYQRLECFCADFVNHSCDCIYSDAFAKTPSADPWLDDHQSDVD